MHLQTTKPRARQIGDTWAVSCETQGIFVSTPSLDAAIKLYYEALLQSGYDHEWVK